MTPTATEALARIRALKTLSFREHISTAGSQRKILQALSPEDLAAVAQILNSEADALSGGVR